MEDEEIVQLYFDRKEQAIEESAKKYGAYCSTIARNILTAQEDIEECVNDTWLHAWNAMPPHRPKRLSTFLGKIARNLSFDRYKSQHRAKRGGNTMELVLDELAECVSGGETPEQRIQEKRYQFLLRYWYAASITEIAKRFHKTENQISVNLFRTRQQMMAYLEERGYSL